MYRYLRGELLARAGNWLVALGRQTEAQQRAAEGLRILEELAASPQATISHVFGGCRWLAETEVRTIRKPARAAEFCRQAMKMTNGEDPDAHQGLATALEQLGDYTGALSAAETAVSLSPPTPAGQSPTRQRLDMEAVVARLRGRTGR